MTEGLRFVKENFGPEARPRVAWHIDPFGHSSEQAALFAKMGYDGFFFARIDYQDKAKRMNESRLEMIWRGSPKNLRMESDIFTGVLYYHYGPPPNFCFDTLRCSDNAVVDNPDLFTYNLEVKLGQFLFFSKIQANSYRTKNIMLTMGSDFQWEDAQSWYANLDIIIDNINKKYANIFNIFYSTPTRYMEAVHNANLTWEVKTDDFFPYATGQHSYWTGFYTSRPALKGYVRELNSFLQTCRHFELFAGGPGGTETSDKLAQAMGVAQHHDAVSGTEKQHVANDYAMRLHIGQVECQSVISSSLNKLSFQSKPQNWEFCEYLNISVCPPSVTNSFDVMVYNPLARRTNDYITIPVNNGNVTLTDCQGNPQPFDIIPVSQQTVAVQGNRSGHALYNMLFNTAGSVPPLGYCTYSVRPHSTLKAKSPAPSYPPKQTLSTTIQNDILQVTFDETTGHVHSITNLNRSAKVTLDQQFFWYNSSFGNKESSQTSNAYVFRPNSSNVFPVNNNNNKAVIKVVEGTLYQEVQQVFSEFVSQVVRLYKGMNFVEFEYTIGPIPCLDGLGREIISRFDTDLASDGTWYTDANGREMQERIRNHRNTWTLNNTEPVAGNYYPVNSRIFIQDKTKGLQFTVLTDRSQGGSSLKDGSVELMVHRRLPRITDFGEAPLNETGQFGSGLIIRGRHWVVFDTIAQSAATHRILGEKLLLRPVLSFARVSNTIASTSKSYSALANQLPPNVHLLTFQYLNKSTLLIRLEHQFEKGEDALLSQPVTLDLGTLFSAFKISTITEMGLGANEKLENIKRLSWNTKQDRKPAKNKWESVKADNITLNPMEIRTFELTLQ